jgi:hypothetical protein
MVLTPLSRDNTMRFVIKANGSQQLLNAPTLTKGVWTHVAVTISGNTGTLYVNGKTVATNTAMVLDPVNVGTQKNYLGKSQWAQDPLFNGLLDDVKFYTSALTAAQVAALAAS